MTPRMIAILASAIIAIAATAGFVFNVFAQKDNGSLTYENPDYNVKIEYPAVGWNKTETNLGAHQVVIFHSTNVATSLFETVYPVSLEIEVERPPIPRTEPKSILTEAPPITNINESASDFVTSFEGDSNYRLIEHNYTKLSGMPAYQGVYYDYTLGETHKVFKVLTIYNNESFGLWYSAEPGYFDQYLPEVKK